jgi:hypothetical protein
MKSKIAQIILSFVFLTTLAACTHSKLDPNEANSSATLGVFSPNVRTPMDDIAVPKELLSQLLEALAEAKHLDRRGSPSPRMTYVLTIKQESISEDFYFFDDFTPSSFSLAPTEATTVMNIVRHLIEKENANTNLEPISKSRIRLPEKVQVNVSGQRFMKSLSKASSCSTARIHFVELPSAAAPADGGKLKA